jgi:hypothetical protein
VLPSSALRSVVDVDAVLKWHLLDVLHCSLNACVVLDCSDVDEELNRLMGFEFGFVPVGRHVGERAIGHCLGFLHILEGINAEPCVHPAEVDAEARTEVVVRIQPVGIGLVNEVTVVPATVGQCQLVPIEVRLHHGKLVSAVGHVFESSVGTTGGTYAHNPPVVSKQETILFSWELA